MKSEQDAGKLPRPVTTAEELDALPVGAIIRAANGSALVRYDNGTVKGWAEGDRRWTPHLPVHVVWE